jgi:hypothetical protein
MLDCIQMDVLCRPIPSLIKSKRFLGKELPLISRFQVRIYNKNKDKNFPVIKKEKNQRLSTVVPRRLFIPALQ